jgi:hypothetical protein
VKPYLVIKTIKKNRYYYWQRTWREGRKVKTWNQYVGPVNKVPRPGQWVPKGQTAMIINTNIYKPMETPANQAGFDNEKRWGNSAFPGVGVNSPAMMEARRSAPRPAPTYQAIDDSTPKMPNPPQFITENGMIKQVYPFPVFTCESCGKDVIEDPKHPGICLECYNPDGTERRPSWEE